MRGSHSSRGLILALAVTCVAPSPSAAFLSGVVGAGQLDTWRCRVVQATGVSALRMGTSDRRKALQTLFTAGVTGIGAMQTCAPASAASDSDLFQAKFQQGVNKRTSRLYGCQTQSNCVSVSASKNPTQFGAPWDFTTQTTDPDKAWASLKAVIAADESLKIEQIDDAQRYLRAIGTSKVPKGGVDDVEFLLIPAEKICTYRSASRNNKFVYPYQVAISDGGYQKERMRGIRERLGWVELNYVGSGIYSDGCGARGDGKCNPMGGLTPAIVMPERRNADAEVEAEPDDRPRADKIRLPF